MGNQHKHQIPNPNLSPMCTLWRLNQNDTCLHLLSCCINIYINTLHTNSPHFIRHPPLPTYYIILHLLIHANIHNNQHPKKHTTLLVTPMHMLSTQMQLPCPPKTWHSLYQKEIAQWYPPPLTSRSDLLNLHIEMIEYRTGNNYHL